VRIQMLPKLGKNGPMLTLDNVSSVLSTIWINEIQLPLAEIAESFEEFSKL
jgi:hypothetical protein